MVHSTLSLEEITRMGEKIYNEKFKDVLEKDHLGEYAVVDVERGSVEVDSDRLVAIEKAKKISGEKLFYIVQVGSTQNPGVNFSEKKYAWNF